MAEGFPAAAAAAAPGIIGLPANNSPANGEYLKGKRNIFYFQFYDFLKGVLN